MDMDRDPKKDLLRGVYEDNKRIDDRSFRAPGSMRRRAAGMGGMLFVIALLIVAGRILVGGAGSAESASGALSEQGGIPRIPVPVDSVDDETPADVGNLSSVRGPLADLFDLGIRTIVIDPGHGGVDPGASGNDGLHEKEITLDVALRLRRRLVQNHGFSVRLTRESDSTLSLRERVEFANGAGADLFVSIHVNRFPSEPVYALETYYFGAGSDDSAVRRAERENRNSDYSVAEFNRLIEGIGSRVKLDESIRLARSVQRSMFRNTRMLNDEVRNWGVKSAPFVVLVGVEAPGILAEIGVISNRDEEQRLATPEYREQLALFMEEGIVNYVSSLDATRDERESDPGVE